MNFVLVSFVYTLSISTVASLRFASPSFNTVVSRERVSIVWEDASGPVMIELRGSNEDNVPEGNVSAFPVLWIIDSQLKGNNFEWIVPITLPTKFLRLEISDDSGYDVSPTFGLKVKLSNETTSDTDSNSNASAPPSTTTSTTSAQETLPSSTTTGQISISTLKPQPKTAGGGLTTAAKAGIGAGAAIGFLVVLAALFLAFRYGKRSASKDNTDNRAELGTGGEGNGKAELGDTGLLEVEGSVPTSEDEMKNVEVAKENERKHRADVLEAKGWKGPAEIR